MVLQFISFGTAKKGGSFGVEMGEENVAWDKLFGEIQKILLSPLLTLFFALFFGVVKFIPKEWAEALSITSIRTGYASWIGLGFLAFVIMNALHFVGWSNRKRQVGIVRKSREARLRTLTRAEKIVLRNFLEEKSRSALLSHTDGVVLGLVEATVLWKPPAPTARGYHCAFNLQNWAWEYLNTHPDCLELN